MVEIEILKSDVKTNKKAIIMAAMEFTKDESSAFWQVQENYELELSNIFDERMELIKDYDQNYENMTDKKADELVMQSLKLEERKTKLKRKYFKKLKKIIPTTKTAAFIQLEGQIERMVALQVSSQLQLIK